MREKHIEQKLIKAVKARDGICVKLTGLNGIPDRMAMLPGAHIGFIELKAPGEQPRPLQLSRHRLIRRLGFSVYVIDGIEQIESVLDEIGEDT